jgi:hypothetical protein
MNDAQSLRVLHSGSRTIFVWVRSRPAPPFLDKVLGRHVSIEICSIPDPVLAALPTIPFD